jgi:hypothetical protein
MDLFRVPQRETPVKVLLDDGRTIAGEFFTPVAGPDGLPGRVLDRLNDVTEDFLALRTEDDRFLINKSGIVLVQMEGDLLEILGAEAGTGTDAPVRLTLAGGTGLVGRLLLAMPVERSRVIDYLNAAPRFFPLLGDGMVTLVRKNYVVSVREL